LIETSQTTNRKKYLLTSGAKYLANKPDLTLVWGKLGDMQIDWIGELSDEEILNENFKKLREKLNREVALTEIEQKSRELLKARCEKALENKKRSTSHF
jgi:hypothetical protein